MRFYSGTTGEGCPEQYRRYFNFTPVRLWTYHGGTVLLRELHGVDRAWSSELRNNYISVFFLMRFQYINNLPFIFPDNFGRIIYTVCLSPFELTHVNFQATTLACGDYFILILILFPPFSHKHFCIL